MKKLLITLVLIPFIGMTQNPSYFKNYTQKKQYKTPLTEAQLPTASTEDRISTIVYYDGLGRPIQTQMLKQGGKDDSGQYVDIMVPVTYDSYGRQSKDYLSLPTSGNSGAYYDTETLIADVKAYYTNAYPEDINPLLPNPYANKILENSPLSRVKAQGAPGKHWRAVEDATSDTGEINQFIRFEYATNAAYEVKRFEVNHPNNNTEMTELVYAEYHPANTLFKTITKDENWTPSTTGDNDLNNDHTTEEFKDKDGRIILKRSYNNHLPHDTYYVYDDYGNLTYVIPPEASDHIIYEGGQGFIANTINYPWIDLMQVDKSFAEDYQKLLKDYDNDALLNADLDNAYGGQGGFTVSTTSSGDLMFSINMATIKPLDIKTGPIVSLKPFGEFKDAELGLTHDENYIFFIQNNSIWVDYTQRDYRPQTDITALNYTFSNGTKLAYNENYAWTEITAIDDAIKREYKEALRAANVTNDAILQTHIANSYNGQGGLNVSIDANDVITLSVNINSTEPLQLKQGILFPLNTKRRFPDKTIGSIGDYTFSIKDNSIYVDGVADFTSLSGTRYATSNPPVYTADPATLEGLCYIYHYDYRNRLIEKKIPGKDWEYIVYDKQDRPVGTQDGHLRVHNNWLFTKYDALGRVTYTGLQKNTNWTRTSLQTAINNNSTFAANNHNSFRDPTGFVINGITVYYTKQTSWPMGFSDVLTVNYYDDYDVSLNSDLHYQDSYGQTQITNARTLATVSKVRVLESNTNYGNHWITTVSYYDDKARPTYVITKNNYLNTTDWVKTQMDDFTSKVLETTSYHHKTGQPPIQTVDRFTYDCMDRLLTHTQRINGEAAELIVNNHYDALGQLETKDVGGDVAALPEQSNGLQSIDYSYTIRGWLKQINDVDQLGNDLFGFKLNYNTTELAGAEALYNGNISETHWVTANDHIKRNYYYKYDALNRINEAIYSNAYQGNDALTTNESYNLLGVDYDKNGNIIGLQRTGRYYQTPAYTGMEHYDMIDNLSYTYAPLSNKLLGVSDAASNAFGFKDGNTGAEDYQYDTNGNMTSDANKGITGISYNHLNLPVKITTANGNIAYIYDASGAKLEKVVTEESSVTSTEYAGSYIYKDDNLEFFSQPEGYIEPDGTRYKYVYQYKDHLGNIRLSYKDNNGSLEIVEENNYYPFGLKHKGYNNVVNGPDHPYGFNGIEEEDELGLNMLSMDMRKYDPTIARWTGIDPVTHHSQSTYNGFDNNPVYWADPSGADVERVDGGYSFTGADASRVFKIIQDEYGGSSSSGEGSQCDDCKEGQTRPVYVGSDISAGGYKEVGKEYYHSGGVNGSSKGWYSKNNYLNIFRVPIRFLAQGRGSIEWFSNLDFTDEILEELSSWIVQATIYYSSHYDSSQMGNAEPMGFSSPFFAPTLALKIMRLKSGAGFVKVNWTGYPEGGIKPKGPFRLLNGEEYLNARKLANSTNRKIRRANPSEYKGYQIHEIHPVKFGGSPTDLSNKIKLRPEQHQAYTNFWNALMRKLNN